MLDFLCCRHRHNGPLSPVGIVPPTLGRRGKRLAEQKMLLSFRLANGNGATPPKRRRIVAARVESPVEDSSPSQRGDDASLGSAVSAPDWPPVKARAAPPTQVATQARKTDKSAVKEHLKGPGAHSLGVDAWEEAEAEDVRRHNHLLRRDVPKRRKVDEYDAEYDSGKVKKVRDKSRPNGRVDSRAFDAAGQTGRKAEALREVQFRGKKKQRQLRRS